MVFFFSQTQELVEAGNIEAARSEFGTSFNCRLGAWIWCAVVSPLLLVVVALALTFIILAALGTFSS